MTKKKTARDAIDQLVLEKLCGLYNPTEGDFETISEDYDVSLIYVKTAFENSFNLVNSL